MVSKLMKTRSTFQLNGLTFIPFKVLLASFRVVLVLFCVKKKVSHQENVAA